MEIIDSHLHIGNISDTGIVTANEVRSHLTAMGVANGLVMPIAMRGGNDDWETHKALYKEALALDFDVALYVNTNMLESSKDLSHYLTFPFKALKTHPDAVDFSDEQIERVCSVAETNGLPLMIHTGADDCCHCERFRPFIKNHPYLVFVLCHARPSNEAFPMMREFHNIWIDTAFLPFRELAANISEDIENRILFGTDFPANRWFPHLGKENEWYQRQIDGIQDKFPEKTAEKILSRNFKKLYKTTAI
ncbi:MAG: amidohydrolase family protein [Bacteroidales bacterium]|nr:amidohydrolase family protein [Bacteroidales bacterium]